MENMSKNLKNLIKISGRKDKINEFVQQIKKEFDIVEINLPEYRITQIDTYYIKNNWNKSVNLEKTALLGHKSKYIILAFANPDFESIIIDLIEKNGLNADYTYLLEDDKTGVIVREFFKEGKSLCSEEFESPVFDIEDYSFALCFKNLYSVYN